MARICTEDGVNVYNIINPTAVPRKDEFIHIDDEVYLVVRVLHHLKAGTIDITIVK